MRLTLERVCRLQPKTRPEIDERRRVEFAAAERRSNDVLIYGHRPLLPDVDAGRILNHQDVRLCR